MRIQHNIPGMRTLRYGKKLNNSTAKTLEKLSSGYCINRAGDDAAGLAVSERIRMSLTEFGRCKNNIQEGINLANTADAALQEVNDMLNRAQELCVAAANGTYSAQERDELQKELDALYSEVDRIFESSRFNEVQLFRHEDNDFTNGRFEYIEKVIYPTDLQEWGALEGIDKEFDSVPQALPATATLALDSDVQSAADLVGKSFSIGNYKVKFTSGYDTGYSYSTDLSIGVSGCTTLQNVFDKLCEATQASTYWAAANASLDKAEVVGRNVTFTFQKTALSTTIQFDNNLKEPYEVAEGTGAVSNDIAISSHEGLSLDAIGIGSNFTATASFQLVPGKADTYALTDADKNLLQNGSYSLHFAGTRFSFVNGASSGSNIGLNGITTAGQLRTAVVDAINKYFWDKNKNINVSAPSADGTVTVTYADYPSGTWIYESPPSSAQ